MACATRPLDAFGILACSEPILARSDIRLVETYYAMRGGADPNTRKALKSSFLAMMIATRKQCGLPPVAPGADQSAAVLPPNAAFCFAAAENRQRDAWFATLSGPAAEEAGHSPEQDIALQTRLRDLGFLPKDALLDGVFGTGVRDAIGQWQSSLGRPKTGFLSDADAVALTGRPASAPKPDEDPWDKLRAAPLATADFTGKPVTLAYRDMSVSMDTEPVDDANVCPSSSKGGLDLGLVVKQSNATTCRAIVAKLKVGGEVVHQVDLAAVDDQTDYGSLRATVSIRRLDTATRQPQVLFTGYSGGGHCCTATLVATEDRTGSWTDLPLEQLDADGFDFYALPRSQGAVLVSGDGRFNYKFSSYSGSYPATVLQSVQGGQVTDVSRDPRYHDFQSYRLSVMESFYRSNGGREPNGYLAGWVAQKALVGQFDDGWHGMLGSYDHDMTSPFTSTVCATDRAAWPSETTGPASYCPADQQIRIPFPQALATALVEMGYVTTDQAMAVGFDVPKLKADQLAAQEVATQAALKAWFLLSKTGVCVRAVSPASPADAVTADREAGTEDDISVLDKDGDGKAAIVRIREPKGFGIENTSTFYRGLVTCEASKAHRQSQLDEIK